MEAAKPVPVDITVKTENQLMIIIWDDGLQTEYKFKVLRAECPCANCKKSHEKIPENVDHKLDPEDFVQINVTDVREVGNYAIQFVWSDQHDLGIYTFEYLRELGA